MRVALAQVNITIGAFEQNAAKVRDFTLRAKAQGADLVLFPELGIIGYPPRDFLEMPEFVKRAQQVVDGLCTPAEWNRGIAVYLGTAEPHDGPGHGLHNAGLLLVDGKKVATARKVLLPTYDVFDEGRYFDAGTEVTLAEIAGTRCGLSICEDIWNDKTFWRKRLYSRDPIEELMQKGPGLLLNISSSPYQQGKPRLREEMLAAAARRHQVPILYVNCVGANDSLVFDGHSAAFDREGRVIARARGFQEELLVVDLPGGGPVAPLADDLDELTEALVVGVRDYAQKTGFRGAVLGLSGGIDSALTAYLAARAFPPDEVLGVAMPSRFTESISNDDARRLAENLGIRFLVEPIEPMFKAYLETLAPAFAGRAPDVTEENLQARVRGTLLMAFSNKFGKLLLTTGNKSELGVGYCTLYGDMAGGLAPIGDLPKMTVYALAKNANRAGEVIPERTIVRPPTAELRENQKDQDSLPPYPTLDAILRAHVEGRLESDAIVHAAKSDPQTVQRILQLVLRSEYKRRQAAPTLRVSPKAFGEGWRFPIAHGFRY